ncbi:hypothetical protein [Natronorubrum thiooxidans]|uniref:Uncharacterized protein n=1 Tax=Natronorubrum thiooxidans TaxID=308853 RepID=A0A1N7GD96_9EURY|nr:hypothetical protein [Natronorubrum thiooxidans]SIS10541.1 hypothetical protein SAMN05421752_11180 [Natronorubrum thiooxidans]
MAEQLTSQTTCPWCTEPIEDDDETVSVGPPPSLSASRHQWELHDCCAQEWRVFVDKLTQLSQQGAHQALIEYPRQHGPEEVVSSSR